MRIEARNLLADAILEALDHPKAAETLRCLAAYSSLTSTPFVAVPVEILCAALPMGQRTETVFELRRCPLLSWEIRDGKEVATLVAPLAEDYASTVAKLRQYATTLTAWVLDEHADARTIALRKATQLFNHHLFFEVHEILEEQWKQEEGDVRLFLQGLIQIAVAFYHLDNNNYRGATALLHDGLTKITPYPSAFLGVELPNFSTRLAACQKELQRLGPERCQQFSRELIPPLSFVR